MARLRGVKCEDRLRRGFQGLIANETLGVAACVRDVSDSEVSSM